MLLHDQWLGPPSNIILPGYRLTDPNGKRPKKEPIYIIYCFYRPFMTINTNYSGIDVFRVETASMRPGKVVDLPCNQE
jgi:hypothetical protein